MTWGFYLIVFWFVVCGLCFFGRALILGLPWEDTSASGRTATRGSIARAVTKVNGYNTLEYLRGTLGWSEERPFPVLMRISSRMAAGNLAAYGRNRQSAIPSSPRVISIMLLAPGC